MKLLTLNTHSLQGPCAGENLNRFVQTVLELRPDLIALQEVNQLQEEALAESKGRFPVPGAFLRRGNYAAEAFRLLSGAGVPCSWAWLPIKRSYDKFDEGLAVFSLSRPIEEAGAVLLSARDDYANWRTRKALGVRLAGKPDWFYTVHMGWWGDEDSFQSQWTALDRSAAEKRKAGPVWLLGDFNAPAHVRGEGYDQIKASGWLDTYALAEERDGGITVQGPIDGWEDQQAGLRIDYIWSSEAVPVARSRVVFNGKEGPVVSDHFGVLVEIKEETP